MAERKLRVQCLIVQPVLLYDDGTELTPGPEIAPTQIVPSQFADFLESLPKELEKLTEDQAL